MIVDLERFVLQERVLWTRLEVILDELTIDPWRVLTIEEARELERLYQRASADLARLATFSSEFEARHYLENLVARGYAEVYGARRETSRFRPWRWLTRTLPQSFRRRFKAFQFAFVLMMAGVIFGGLAISFDPASKEVLLPFSHLQGSPAERVMKEEQRDHDRSEGKKASFSGFLMTHNTQVTLMSMALGITWGIGTLILMFYNGVILGAVALDYILAGQTKFLLGWLLPHGVIEIPAMLVGGQAGFILASALIGRGAGAPLATRFREILPDVVTLCFGAALMLVWAGIIEAYLSQYHEPVIPYSVKIGFGLLESAALWWFLLRAGQGTDLVIES